MASPVSLSPVNPNFYLETAYSYTLHLYSAFHAYAPSTTSFLSKLSVLSLLGYVLLLFLVLFTHGTIPETIKTQGKALVITPTNTFMTCVVALLALLALAPLEHTYGGSFFAALAQFPLPSFNVEGVVLSMLGLTLLHVATFALYALLPAVSAPGYVLGPGGEVTVNRLPGFRVHLVALVAWLGGVRGGVIRSTLLWDHLPEVAAASCLLGLFLSCAFFLRGGVVRRSGGSIDERERCPTSDMTHLIGKGPIPAAQGEEAQEFRSRGPLDHFYCGLSEFNPFFYGVDWKMWLYATGAVLLQLNVLSALAADAATRPSGLPSNGATAVGACLTFFVTEYMWQEHVHLWTYDIFRERLGFKLLWGCLCWYPNFYLAPLGAVVGTPRDVSPLAASLCVALFFVGWAFTRGANLQKWHCKTSPPEGPMAPFLGFIPMVTVPGSKGRLLCSGFWGVSRHVNYAGEIAQAVALCLVATLMHGSILAWAYPAYYVAIFLPRQVDDDHIMENKYGQKVWKDYCKRVPYRVLPGVY